jgi:signal transduction histidine kinase
MAAPPLTSVAPAVEEPLLELFEALQHHQVRNGVAEVAAAIAHALGTPLNVISGRAELIRQDPANAVAQVARIEEQVMKVATGLRQLVDYLAVPDALTSGRLVSTDTASANGQGNVPATRVVEEVLALLAPTVKALGAELVVDVSALETAAVDRWHALGVLTTLVSLAVRCAGKRRVGLTGSVVPGWAVFELHVPALPVMSGWHLEHFQTRPPATESAEPYRELSICAAVVRGHGGKLQIEAAPGGVEPAPNEEAALIRYSYKT